MSRLILSGLAITTLFVAMLPARLPAAEHDAALWTVNQLAVPVDDRFAFHVMVQNRWVREIDTYERTVVRPWLSFDWTERVELALGYDAHLFENPRSTLENRAWQRIGYRHAFGEAALFAHLWQEERFFENTDSVAWRSRFQIGGSLALPRNFGLTVRNEFFVDLNGTSRVRRAGLGENQFFAGVRHPLGRRFGVEIGYLMQYLDRTPDLFNHGLVIGFSARTPKLTRTSRSLSRAPEPVREGSLPR